MTAVSGHFHVALPHHQNYILLYSFGSFWLAFTAHIRWWVVGQVTVAQKSRSKLYDDDDNKNSDLGKRTPVAHSGRVTYGIYRNKGFFTLQNYVELVQFSSVCDDTEDLIHFEYVNSAFISGHHFGDGQWPKTTTTVLIVRHSTKNII